MRGYQLPWLKWLLVEGTKPIVKNYAVKFGPNKSSRTGMAVMVNSSSNWSVPSEFAGTISSNWISRAIDDISDLFISSIIENEIRKNL